MENNTKYKKIIGGKSIERVSEESVLWHSKRLLKEHEIRYVFAKKFVKGKKVVDIACGSGYGSNMLVRSGAKILYGIDNDKAAISYAKQKYKDGNIKFTLGNAEKIPLRSNLADIIVSFETIEHLKYPKKFLKEIKRTLKPKGILILSTPNRDISYEDNPYHLKEYTLPELDMLLSDFSKRVYYGQRPIYKRVVRIYKYLYIS